MNKIIQRVQSLTAHGETQTLRAERLSPLLKWAGGKEQELRHILPMIPPFHRYYEPFVGGGAVFFSIQAEIKYINDKSFELINLYRMTADNNFDFFHTLDALLDKWRHIRELVEIYAADFITLYDMYSTDECSTDGLRDDIQKFVLCHMIEIKKNLLRKLIRMNKLEAKRGILSCDDVVANIESAFKSAFYIHLRHIYNNITGYKIPSGPATAIFFFVRENAYASMFRYNSHGEFNVPYGGISYNRKDLARKIAHMQSPEVQRYLVNTVIENMDFVD